MFGLAALPATIASYCEWSVWSALVSRDSPPELIRQATTKGRLCCGLWGLWTVLRYAARHAIALDFTFFGQRERKIEKRRRRRCRLRPRCEHHQVRCATENCAVMAQGKAEPDGKTEWQARAESGAGTGRGRQAASRCSTLNRCRCNSYNYNNNNNATIVKRHLESASTFYLLASVIG